MNDQQRLEDADFLREAAAELRACDHSYGLRTLGRMATDLDAVAERLAAEVDQHIADDGHWLNGPQP